MHRTILCMVLTFMAVGCLWFSGCGDSDLLDEMNQRYSITGVSFEDAGDADTYTIDVLRDTDCNDDGNATDPEDFTDVLATISINVEDENAYGITLDGYTIDYIPEQSTYVGGGQDLPPELDGLDDRGSNTSSIPAGGSGSITITCLTVSTKQQFIDRLGSTLLSLGDTARYTIRITLYFLDEVGVERVIEVNKTIYLNNYDNC